MTDHLWKTAQMIEAMAGRPRGAMPDGIGGISIDSRSLSAGDAFFAIKGDRVDGHDYANVAVANGAGVLVVSEAKLPALGSINAPMIVVPEVLEAMEKLGRVARDRSRAKIIAVTGSVGKTTTKEMLRHVLSACGSVHYSPASFNNHWGVPLTLSRLSEAADFGVFEIGMNHPDEIRPLVKMVRPHVAIITTIAAAHLGHFKNLEEIAAAKAEIFEGLEPGGVAILNRDNKQFDFLEKKAQEDGVSRVCSFGQHAKADFRLADFEGNAESSTVWAVLNGETSEIQIGAPGRHIAENAMAALGACLLVNADMPKAMEALAVLRPVKGRGERHLLGIGEGHLTLIDESYNANPASVRAAIALLASATPEVTGRRIAVLGDMLEMGEFSAAVHEELAGPLLAAGIEHVWLAGPEMAALRDALPESVEVQYYEKTADLADFVVRSVIPGDVVMVKSSLGLGFGKIVAALLDNYPAFSDTERQL